MKRAITFLFFIVEFTIFIFGCVHFDLSINPWLYQTAHEWKWYNFVTSQHGITALYINGWFWLIPALILSTIFSSVITFALIPTFSKTR